MAADERRVSRIFDGPRASRLLDLGSSRGCCRFSVFVSVGVDVERWQAKIVRDGRDVSLNIEGRHGTVGLER